MGTATETNLNRWKPLAVYVEISDTARRGPSTFTVHNLTSARRLEQAMWLFCFVTFATRWALNYPTDCRGVQTHRLFWFLHGTRVSSLKALAGRHLQQIAPSGTCHPSPRSRGDTHEQIAASCSGAHVMRTKHGLIDPPDCAQQKHCFL